MEGNAKDFFLRKNIQWLFSLWAKGEGVSEHSLSLTKNHSKLNESELEKQE